MAKKPQQTKRVMVFATYAPDPKKLENMLELKAHCERLCVSLPKEVVDFFAEFPQHEGDEHPCSHGQHTRLLQHVIHEFTKSGMDDYLLVHIPRTELDSIKDVEFNRLIVFLPLGVEIESA